MSGETPREAAVELDQLSKRYDQVEALRGVSLSVGSSRFLVLLGPSGSGKSTLIRCLAGIDRPTAGRITIAGRLVADDRTHVPPERRDLAMVFQDFALWPHMTASENVRFALRRRSIDRHAADVRARSMLDRVGLGSHSERYPHELSGGEQQRVALARALVANPALLLFDEPLSSLDANLRERLRIEIGTLVREQGATAVYITHDQSEAFALGDEIGILQAGRLVQHGTPESIYRTPATPFVAHFTGLAGTLRGRMIGRSRGSPPAVHAAIPTTDHARQLALLGTPMQPLSPGDAIQIMLRPTAVRLCSPDGRAALLRATIRDSAFHGRGYDYVLQLGNGIELGGVFDRRRFARGDTVGVHIDPKGALVFGDNPVTPVTPLPSEALPVAGLRATVSTSRSDASEVTAP